MNKSYVKSKQVGNENLLRIYPSWIEDQSTYLQLNSLLSTTGSTKNESVQISHCSINDQKTKLEGSSKNFNVQTNIDYQKGICDYFDAHMKVTYTGTKSFDAGLQVRYEMIGSGKPTWMIPGAFYKENRFFHNTRIYPRYDSEGGEVEKLESDYWAFRSDRAALPTVFSWNDQFCGALFTEEMSELGLTGVGFVGNKEETGIWLNFPYREEPKTFFSPVDPKPADCQTYHWEPGETVTLQYKIYVGREDLHSYDPFVRELYRQHQKMYPLQP